MNIKTAAVPILLILVAVHSSAASNTMKMYKSRLQFRISYPATWHIDASSCEGYKSIRDIRPGNDPYIQIYNVNPDALAEGPDNYGPISADNIKIEIHFYFKNPESMDDWLKGRPADAEKEFIIINRIRACTLIVDNEEYPGYKIINMYYTTGKRAIQVYCYPADTKHLKMFYKIMESFRFE